MLMRTVSDFGAVIRDRRKAKGLTQTDLAKQIGVRQSWVSDIESGRHDNPGLGILLQVCKVLGIDIRVDRATSVKSSDSTGSGDLATADPAFLRRGRR
ncbi:transcriptional regulator [Tardiphaga alba]|uniref:Transcriptional regulator n=1 Tax=Tardiphaga alba TaxID=340268 RepID=A0ABX8ACM5_9BRAD|nr:helix-turn-helix domain-containing protein [Tardiphaga alba]QUS41498.1 transcriptional regulator [Tardiphaga alba]